jgi:hypothetical protein
MLWLWLPIYCATLFFIVVGRKTALAPLKINQNKEELEKHHI